MSRGQLFVRLRRTEKDLEAAREQIRWLQRSIAERNARAECAERAQKAAEASEAAIRKLYIGEPPKL